MDHPRPHVRARSGRPACPLCREGIAEESGTGPAAEAIDCPGCAVRYHATCLAELGGCAVLGCPERAPTRPPRDAPSPALAGELRPFSPSEAAQLGALPRLDLRCPCGTEVTVVPRQLVVHPTCPGCGSVLDLGLASPAQLARRSARDECLRSLILPSALSGGLLLVGLAVALMASTLPKSSPPPRIDWSTAGRIMACAALLAALIWPVAWLRQRRDGA